MLILCFLSSPNQIVDLNVAFQWRKNSFFFSRPTTTYQITTIRKQNSICSNVTTAASLLNLIVFDDIFPSKLTLCELWFILNTILSINTSKKWYGLLKSTQFKHNCIICIINYYWKSQLINIERKYTIKLSNVNDTLAYISTLQQKHHLGYY